MIRAGQRLIGEGQPCFIAAEVGINHNGDLELAREMVRAAAAAGVDGVKFQNFATEDFLSDHTLTYTYKSQGRQITESQWDMFKRAELKPGWLENLKVLCDSMGVVFFSTPTSEDGVRELVDLRACLLKNGSDYLTHVPLLELMASTGIPVVVSTGMADHEDIDAAMAAIRRGGRSDIILLHCTSSYPTAPSDTNLLRMIAMRDRYDVPVGFSDHTEGWAAAAQAVTLGACFLEKHFTLDHQLPGPDHWFSSTPDELREYVQQVRFAGQRLGNRELQPAASEAAGRKEYRLSAVAAHDLEGGSLLRDDMVMFRRPGTGLLPKDLRLVLGRKLAHPLASGAPIRKEDLL